MMNFSIPAPRNQLLVQDSWPAASHGRSGPHVDKDSHNLYWRPCSDVVEEVGDASRKFVMCAFLSQPQLSTAAKLKIHWGYCGFGLVHRQLRPIIQRRLIFVRLE